MLFWGINLSSVVGLSDQMFICVNETTTATNQPVNLGQCFVLINYHLD